MAPLYHLPMAKAGPRGTLDLTPTWLGLLPGLLAVITDHDKTPAGNEAAKLAREQLRNMAGLADALRARHKNAVIIERELRAIVTAMKASSDPAMKPAAEKLAKLTDRI